MKAIGKKHWVIPGGHIPLGSTGKEPELLSKDQIAVLNTGNEPVRIELTVYYSGQDAISEYNIDIKGQRIKKIRINDLINPLPVFLETPYALEIKADREVVVQFLRMDTRQNPLSIMGSMGFGTDQ